MCVCTLLLMKHPPGEGLCILLCKQTMNAHNSLSHKDGILDSYRLVFLTHSIKFNYLYWVWGGWKAQPVWSAELRPTDAHKSLPDTLFSPYKDVCVSYSPGTTDLWTWGLEVLRTHPSFSSASTPVAPPKSPKHKEHRDKKLVLVSQGHDKHSSGKVYGSLLLKYNKIK